MRRFSSSDAASLQTESKMIFQRRDSHAIGLAWLLKRCGAHPFFHKSYSICKLSVANCFAEHDGSAQEFCEAVRFLPCHQNTVRDHNLVVGRDGFLRIDLKSLARMRLVPGVEREPWENSRCSQRNIHVRSIAAPRTSLFPNVLI